MKIFSTIKWLFAPLPAPSAATDEVFRHWLRDPLSHPDLDAMSSRQLGDVPLRPACLARCEA